MRYTCYGLSSLIVCGLFCSCFSERSRHLEKKLNSLWELSDCNLDSAIWSAKLIGDSISDFSEYTKRRYELLVIRLRDKQDMIPSSADSAKTLVEYFEKHGTLKDKMRAYHYLSSAYRDLHDSPNAILYDLKAAEVANAEDVKDSAMLEKIYSQLSTLYRKQLNMEKSIEMATMHYDVSSDKMWAAMDMANAYHFCKDSVNSIKCYDECYETLVKDTTFNYHPALHAELLARYSYYGISEKADSLYRLLRSLPFSYQPDNYNPTMGEYFITKHEVDSALHYYKATLTTSYSSGQMCDAAYALMSCYNETGTIDSVAKYALLFAQYNDSVILERMFEQTRNADAEYCYRRNVEEENQILQREETQRIRIYIISLLLIMTVMGGSLFYFYRRKQMLEQILSKDQQIKSCTQEIQEKEVSIESAKETISNLDKQLAELYNQIGKKQVQNDTLLQLALMRKAEDNASEVIEKFKKASAGQYPLTDDEWKELISAIDEIYPEFKSLLQQKISRLSKPIIQTAYMMKAGLSNPQIANLMGIPRQTVWYRSNAIKKALGDDMQINIDTV